MLDPQLLDASERSELDDFRAVSAHRPAINDLLGYHKFQESLFPEGAGRCDQCGGGELAACHQKPIDHGEQLQRIATALERIADVMEDAEQTAADQRIAEAINARVRSE